MRRERAPASRATSNGLRGREVDIAENPQGIEFLHRDVLNVCDWFSRRGVDADGEQLFAELLAAM